MSSGKSVTDEAKYFYDAIIIASIKADPNIDITYVHSRARLLVEARAKYFRELDET